MRPKPKAKAAIGTTDNKIAGITTDHIQYEIEASNVCSIVFCNSDCNNVAWVEPIDNPPPSISSGVKNRCFAKRPIEIAKNTAGTKHENIAILRRSIVSRGS